MQRAASVSTATWTSRRELLVSQWGKTVPCSARRARQRAGPRSVACATKRLRVSSSARWASASTRSASPACTAARSLAKVSRALKAWMENPLVPRAREGSVVRYAVHATRFSAASSLLRLALSFTKSAFAAPCATPCLAMANVCKGRKTKSCTANLATQRKQNSAEQGRRNFVCPQTLNSSYCTVEEWILQSNPRRLFQRIL